MGDATREIKEHLARARGYFHNHEVVRSLLGLASALKVLVERPVYGLGRQEITNLVLELTQLLNRTSEVQAHLPEGLEYAKGGEKRLLAVLIRVVKAIKEEAERESLDEARQRKLKLDRAIIRGQRLLDAKKVAEAEEAFGEALSFYVNEHKVFYYIALKLLKAALPRQALKYLQRALEKDGDDPQTYIALSEAYEQLGDLDKAEAFGRKGVQLFADSPEAQLELSRILEHRGKLRDAALAAREALELSPGLPQAKKALARIMKKAKATQAAQAPV